MEDKTKIKTTPTSIYQQPLENNRIKTALQLIINGRQNKNKKNTNKYLPIAIRKQQKNKNSINNK